ncbi:hypothetical protein BAUCODRAFT_287199 [Baudoinia panamericana UAMH 10762]|uniref:Uncharacterized protein n=1 Tax=Baudoinia panamericana (strain UAMH 10762) TaxID=717646 RepID=M2MLX0_BAUPA|nr:uncharacterized protein BAUCODRAFT_287199 [Baudoinia panamericana UAMH 10762]EMC92388.1 hypothetical protein BAUCODRAFT_287199 [Baudoinia panamericana UAMH 10762]
MLTGMVPVALLLLATMVGLGYCCPSRLELHFGVRSQVTAACAWTTEAVQGCIVLLGFLDIVRVWLIDLQGCGLTVNIPHLGALHTLGRVALVILTTAIATFATNWIDTWINPCSKTEAPQVRVFTTFRSSSSLPNIT